MISIRPCKEFVGQRVGIEAGHHQPPMPARDQPSLTTVAAPTSTTPDSHHMELITQHCGDTAQSHLDPPRR
jgi:hypothetical protein